MKFGKKDKQEDGLKLLKILEVSNDDSAIPVDLMDKLYQYIIRCKAGELKKSLFELGQYDNCPYCKEQTECKDYASKCKLVYAMQEQFKAQLKRW